MPKYPSYYTPLSDFKIKTVRDDKPSKTGFKTSFIVILYKPNDGLAQISYAGLPPKETAWDLRQ